MKHLSVKIALGIILLFLGFSLVCYMQHRPGVLKEKAKKADPQNLKYSIYVFNMPLMRFHYSAQEEEFLKAKASLRPFGLLDWISQNRIGFDIMSMVDPENLLPVEFTQTSARRLKKGKKGRSITYDHGQRLMQRRGYTEDIYSDTRDPLSLFVWLMHRDYREGELIKSSLNFGRNLLLVVGKVKKVNKEEGVVHVNFDLVKLDKALNDKSFIRFNVVLVKGKKGYIPVSIKKVLGLLQVPVYLN